MPDAAYNGGHPFMHALNVTDPGQFRKIDFQDKVDCRQVLQIVKFQHTDGIKQINANLAWCFSLRLLFRITYFSSTTGSMTGININPI